MGDAASMKVIAIVGHSGSGKTTLIEKLLPVLTRMGLTVATIKHTHHQVAFDTPGKDSWRFKQAGAVASMLVTPQALQLVADLPDLQDPVQLAQRYFSDVDLVLAESFSQANCPKIEVLRAACSTTPRCGEGLIALVTDMPGMKLDVPHFDLYAIENIGKFIFDRVQR